MTTHHVKRSVQVPTSQDHTMTLTARAQPKLIKHVKVARLPCFRVHTIILFAANSRVVTNKVEWNALSATPFAQV